MNRPRGLRALAPLIVAALLLTSCSSGKSEEKKATPEQTMATAKKLLDETSGVKVTLSSQGLPDSVNGVAGAEGVGNSTAGFKGSIGVTLNGSAFDVPVVATGGKVWAQIPLTTGWSDIDPADYNAPDPAALLSADAGFSSLLTATTELAAGESVRGGSDNSEILTSYTGKLDEVTMSTIIPTATGTFDATYTVGDDDRVREMELTGVFYPDTDPMTYTVEFGTYDIALDITAP
jgi:lipoprotein LprG